MPLWLSDCPAAASRRLKLAAANLFPAIIVLLLGVCEATPSTGPSGPSHLRLFTSPSAIGGSVTIYPSISSPGNPYLSDGAVKRSAHLFFSDRHRSNGKRSDALQSLEEHIYPWVIRDANQDLFSSPEIVEAALARTLFFGDFPHERTLEAHLTMRQDQGLPTLRLGSIRFTSPYLLPL